MKLIDENGNINPLLTIMSNTFFNALFISSMYLIAKFSFSDFIQTFIISTFLLWRYLEALNIKENIIAKSEDGHTQKSFIIFYLILLYSYGEYNNSSSILTDHIYLYALGISFIIIGIFIRYISIKSLDTYFTCKIRIFEDHQLIQNGIYKYIRHPAYLGFFLIFFGYIVILQSIIGLFLLLSIGTLLVYLRIEKEETALLKKFGIKYLNYRKNTKALIPFLL